VKRTITVPQEVVVCDRCDGKVGPAGGKFALTPLGLIEAAEDEDDSNVEAVAGHDKGGAVVQTWLTVDLCRNCKMSLLGWWKRPRRDEDDDDDETCGARDGEHECQLASGHEGAHAEPSADLETTHTWSTPPEKPPTPKRGNGKAATP
jgi:hypothetical protein